MQDAPQQNDQTAPDSEPLDEQAFDHVAGGVTDAPGIIGGGCIPTFPWEPTPPWILPEGT